VEGRPVVRRGVDRKKDQSYQLFCVAEENLARTRLPLGALEKSEVRGLAERVGLRTAQKADSQEICFVPSNDYRRLLEQEGRELHPGRFVDSSGRVLGEHVGTEHFTVGQRRGHGIGGGTPLYVLEVHPDSGTVVLGGREEAHFSALEVDELNWIGVDPPASGSLRCVVQHRYHCDPASATVEVDGDRGRVLFDEPQLAVTAGQGAALYDGDRLLGGGWISGTTRVGGAPASSAGA